MLRRFWRWLTGKQVWEFKHPDGGRLRFTLKGPMTLEEYREQVFAFHTELVSNGWVVVTRPPVPKGC